MRGTERLMIDVCVTCNAWFGRVTLTGPRRTLETGEIPGTAGVNACRDIGMHGECENIGYAQIGRLAHWALSTVIMGTNGTVPARVALRDSAHIAQEWIGCPNAHRRTGAPSTLFDRYGLSDYGMTTARHAVRLYATVAESPDVPRWLSIATILRGPLARRG